MKYKKVDDDFYLFEYVPKNVVHAIYGSVPTDKRFKDGSKWYVHKEYADVLVEMAANTETVDRHLGSEYSGLTGGGRTLYLTADAPDFVVDAVWKALARHYHPDKDTGNAELFKEFKKAYDKRKNGNN